MENYNERGGNGKLGDILTAKEMVDFAHGTKEAEGISYSRESDDKTLWWNGSSEERREVDNRLQKMFEELGSPRGVITKQQLSEGTWDLDSKTALVTKHLGKHFEFMGSAEGPHTRLVAEEALFLLESSSLNLTLGDVSLSVQQGYQLMLGGQSCGIKEYLVYSKLIKSGFKVVRHQGDLGITMNNQYPNKFNQKKDFKAADQNGVVPVFGRRLNEPDEDISIEEIRVEEQDEDMPEVIAEILMDLISSVVNHCENQVEDCPPLSPKYEPSTSDYSRKCGLCAAVHSGGEENCKARTFPKRCKFCSKIGHLEKVHWEVDPEFRKLILEAVNDNKNGDVFSEQMMWGHFADIVSDDDENDIDPPLDIEKNKGKSPTSRQSGDEVIELDDSSDDDRYSHQVIEDDSDEDEVKDKPHLAKYGKNPFHSQEPDEELAGPCHSKQPDKELDVIDLENETPVNRYTCDKDKRSLSSSKIHKTSRTKEVSNQNDIHDLFPMEFCSNGSPKYQIQGSAFQKIQMLKRKIGEICSSGGATQYPGLVYAYCEACNVECSSRVVYESHMVGKKHLKMEMRLGAKRTRVHMVTNILTKEHDTEVVTVEETVSSTPRIETHIKIPNGFNKSNIKIKFFDLSLLPPGAQPAREVYHINLDALRKTEGDNLPYEQLEMEQNKEPPSKKPKPSFFCEVCQQRLDNSDEAGILVHIESERHKMNLYDGDDVIVIDDNDKIAEKRQRQMDQCRNKEERRNFRGFYPKAPITRPLAISERENLVHHNFGYHSKPKKFVERKKKWNSSFVNRNHTPFRKRMKEFGKRSHPKNHSEATNKYLMRVNQSKRRSPIPTTHDSLSKSCSPIPTTHGSLSKSSSPIPTSQSKAIHDLVRRSKIYSKSRQPQPTSASGTSRDFGGRTPTKSPSPTLTCIDILDDDVDIILDDDEEGLGDGPLAVDGISDGPLDVDDDRGVSSAVDDLGEVSFPDDKLSEGPLSILWGSGGVSPLLRPDMAGSTEEVMKRMDVFKKPERNQIISSNYDDRELGITYDLYLNTTNFRKTMKKLPDFYVIVLDCHDQVPYRLALLELGRKLCDQVPLLLAVVNAGNVLFFSLSEIDLPDLVSMG